MISKSDIDSGKSFDWGRTSADYAKYRDIYPPRFYERLLSRGIGTNGQQILDLGTGTCVLPRALYPYGAYFTGTDISPEQIAAWEAEHLLMLNEKAAESFTVQHFAAICELTKK